MYLKGKIFKDTASVSFNGIFCRSCSVDIPAGWCLRSRDSSGLPNGKGRRTKKLVFFLVVELLNKTEKRENIYE